MIIFKTQPVELSEHNEKERSFLAVGSLETEDRDGDVVKADSFIFDNWIKNPIIPWFHRYGDPPVAQAIEAKTVGKKLVFRPKFATAEDYPFADTVYRLYVGRYLRAFSIGTNPLESEPRQAKQPNRPFARTITKQELLEISACTLGIHPDALAEAKKNGLEIPDELSQPSSIERLQGLEAAVKSLADKYEALEKAMQDGSPNQADDISKTLAAIQADIKALKPSTPAEPDLTLTPETVQAALDGVLAKKIDKAVKDSLAFHLGQVP